MIEKSIKGLQHQVNLDNTSQQGQYLNMQSLVTISSFALALVPLSVLGAPTPDKADAYLIFSPIARPRERHNRRTCVDDQVKKAYKQTNGANVIMYNVAFAYDFSNVTTKQVLSEKVKCGWEYFNIAKVGSGSVKRLNGTSGSENWLAKGHLADRELGSDTITFL